MNIFAHELASILRQHGKELGSLYGLRSATFQLLPNKVTRLKRSLTEDITATLNAEELELLQEWVPLDSEGMDLRRLRAALLAEAVRHLLGGRMDRDMASQLGELTFQLLLGQEPRQFMALRDELLETLRRDDIPAHNKRDALRGLASSGVTDMGPAVGQIERALEAAVEAYEQGALWLEVARETLERGARLGYLAHARTLLTRAQDLATNVPTVALGTAEQQEWLAAIEKALADTTSLS